jgi:hypothetical protein
MSEYPEIDLIMHKLLDGARKLKGYNHEETLNILEWITDDEAAKLDYSLPNKEKSCLNKTRK